MQRRTVNAATHVLAEELMRLRPVAANAVVIFCALLLYKLIPLSLIDAPASLWDTLFLIAVVYLVGYAAWTILWGSAESKGELVLSLCVKILRERWELTTPQERLALRAVAVKFIYIPLMVAFIITNAGLVYRYLPSLFASGNIGALLSISAFNTAWYPVLFYSLIVIDVSYFAFGYIVDHAFFGNVIKSVDTTFLGWASALACYPPFNSATASMLGWYASDMNGPFSSEWAVFAFNIVASILFAVYVWATVSLGTKCSNLTNRGIVCTGAYAYVRHPAYAAKNAVWLLSVLPLMNVAAYASALAWAGVYYVRAITEERHLSQDPDYLAYKAKVKWRFVPYIW